ncbi:hypothetical protein GH714_013494 [Hevea brasiliensis]|uniref:Serine-threonine/tyrosine-protein kinase catalytic domain-containing protein n=1 Tax=Hevea brasiliensis TaxID=3981 RepID=A0A6A6N4N8_HEVBR|nr:hypothetical protein GH714_013494 [Hevea brasiliensis]
MAESINIDVEEDENYSLLDTCRVDAPIRRVEKEELHRGWGENAWFYYPYPNLKPSGMDIIGLACTIFQCVFTSIAYSFLSRGKRAIFKDDENGGTPSVVDFAVPRIMSGGLVKVLDPRVGQAEAVVLVAYTALRCVNLEAKDRPSMTDVVVNLEKALFLCNGRMEGEVLNSLDRSKIEEGTLKES